MLFHIRSHHHNIHNKKQHYGLVASKTEKFNPQLYRLLTYS